MLGMFGVSKVIILVRLFRPHLPIAANVDEARQILGSDAQSQPAAPSVGASDRNASARRALTDILVPLIGDVTVENATLLARHLARAEGAKVRLHLVYVLEVPRALPLAASLPDEEARASQMMERAQAVLKKEGFLSEQHVTRARDVAEEIVCQALEVRANMIVLACTPWQGSNESANQVIRTLLSRSPCEVVLSRPALTG